MKFVPILEELHFKGTSDDEKVEVKGQKFYLINALHWRSKEFTEFLHVFDRIYISNKIDGTINSTGNYPRLRVERQEPKVSSLKLKPVPGLPRNCYDEKFLKGLFPAQLKKLNVQPPMDLTHSDAVMR